MSLDLIKNDKNKAFHNLFIKEYYTALLIKYLNNDIWLKKNLRSGYIRKIVSAMTMLPTKFTFFSTCSFIFVFVHLTRNAS